MIAGPTPRVSVVMPAFNAASTIVEAVGTVLNQTIENLELIVCDDASSDDTRSLLSSIQDLRLKIISNPINLGPGASRDAAIRRARAPWVAFIDADDAWKKHRMERMLAATSGEENAVVFDDIMECRTLDGAVYPSQRMRGIGAFGAGTAPIAITPAQLIRSKRMLMQPLFSRKLAQNAAATHSSHHFGEDSHFLLNLLANGGKLFYVPEAMYLYRIGSNTASSNPSKYYLLLDVLNSCLPDFEDDPDTHAALAAKISSLKRQQARFEFTQAIKFGEFASAITILFLRPNLMSALVYHNADRLFRRLLPRYR